MAALIMTLMDFGKDNEIHTLQQDRKRDRQLENTK
jgi:hypothetical protein